MKRKIIKNIPNMITSVRLILSIIAPIVLITGNPIGAGILYFIGAISDAFDGFFARKLNAYSDFGKKLDGLSDKMYALGLLFPALVQGNLLMLIPLLLEGRISVTNILSNKLNLEPSTEKIGKIKTILLFPTLLIGAYVPLIKELYFLLIPLLVGTTALQIKCVKAYDKQLLTKINEKKKTETEREVKIHNKENEQAKTETYSKPLTNVIPLERELKPKNKKKVKTRRKKDDRY